MANAPKQSAALQDKEQCMKVVHYRGALSAAPPNLARMLLKDGLEVNAEQTVLSVVSIIILISSYHCSKTPDRAEFSPQQRNEISRFSSPSHTGWCYTALLIDYKIIQQAALFMHLLSSLLPPHLKPAALQGPGPCV